jgi:hypothetical protein
MRRAVIRKPLAVYLPICTLRKRIARMIWGIATGLLTAVGVGWMTGAPWLAERMGQLLQWLPRLP